MEKILLLLLLFCCIESKSQDLTKELRRELRTNIAQGEIKGFGVAIYNREQVLFAEGFGVADATKGVAYNKNTIQKVASISKTFLGVATMKALDLGLFTLEDDINDYLPFSIVNPHTPQAVITIADLATHTGGLKQTKLDMDALYFPSKIAPIKNEIPMGLKKLVFKRIVKKLNHNDSLGLADFLYQVYHPRGKWYSKKNFLKEGPGEKHVYSNNGAALLSLVIEKASGKKYYDFVKEYIFDPLEMEATCFDFQSPENASHLESKLYHSGVLIPNDFLLITYPAGGIETTVDDYARYMSSMLKGYYEGNQILTKESYRFMMEEQIEEANQGILWRVFDTSIGHRGDIAGVTTSAYFKEETGTGFLVFCNSAGSKSIDKQVTSIISILEKYAALYHRGLKN